MWWILFSLFVCCNVSFGQMVPEEETISLVIEQPKIPKEFGETEKNQTGKIILKATTKVKGYQIIIGDFDPAKKAKFQVHVVDMEAVPDANGEFTLTARLFDEKSKKLINKVSYPRVPKIAYFRELERLMNELFLPVMVEKEKEPKKEEPLKKPPITKLPAAPTEAEVADLDFKQRIMSLKNGIDTKLKDIADAKKTDKDQKESSEVPVQPPKPLAELAAAPMPAELVPEKPPLKHPSFNNIKPLHRVGMFYRSNTTNSLNVTSDIAQTIKLDIDTTITYFGFAYFYQRPVVIGKDHFWQTEVELAKVQNKNKEAIEFSPYIHAYGDYAYLFRSWGVVARSGLDIDTYSFAYVPLIGQGLKAVNLRVVNFMAGAQWAGNLITLPIIVGIDYMRPVFATSDNTDTPAGDLSGSMIKGALTFAGLPFHLNIKFEMYTASYDFGSKKQLTTSTKGFGFHVNYVF